MYQNFTGDVRVTVIGEKPPWYTGHFIPCARVVAAAKRRVTSQRAAFADTANKICVASRHPEIDEEFVWMMDDTFLLRPTTIEDLKIPRYDPWFRAILSREWHRLIQATFNALRARGKPAFQVGTHLPHVFEKTKLVEMQEIYNYPSSLLLFEILYGNHFREGFIPYGNNWQGVEYPLFLRRLLKRARSVAELDQTTAASAVLNYQSVCFDRVMRQWLEGRFREASVVE